MTLVLPHPARARKTGLHWLSHKNPSDPDHDPRFVALQWNMPERTWSHSGQPATQNLPITQQNGYARRCDIPTPAN